MIKFDKKRLKCWEREYYWWKEADNLLYKLFKKPNNKFNLRSKIVVLSRYYLTNIEKKTTVFKLADKMLGSIEFEEISKILSKSPYKYAKFKESTEIYSIHSKLVKLIKKTTKTEEQVFASKFLHFWKPDLFPILDRVVLLC